MPTLSSELKVAFLDCVSHGDCAVITFKEGNRRACIVVDGGNDDSSAAALRQYLDDNSVKRIDLLVGTHIDQDHIQGLNKFLELEAAKPAADRVKIKEYWGPLPQEDAMNTHTPAFMMGGNGNKAPNLRFVIESVKQNDNLHDALKTLKVPIKYPSLEETPKNPFKGVRIEVLGPDKQIPSSDIKKSALAFSTLGTEGLPIDTLEDLENAVEAGFEAMAAIARRTANNQSIVFRVTPPASACTEAKKWRFLFSGDAEQAAWKAMLEEPKVAKKLPAKVLKIPHHGSTNGITKPAAEAVGPDHSVNSVGQKHGIPDADVLGILHGLGSEIYCTQRNVTDDGGKKSACYALPDDECCATGNNATVCFTLDLQTGDCVITPENRACTRDWPQGDTET